MRTLWMVAIIVLTLVGSPAEACSPVEGYVVPTNFELVQKSDVIVLAKVIDGPRSYDNGLNAAVRLRPIRYLKGIASTPELKVIGLTRWNGRDIDPIVTPLSEAHFSVGLGACVRQFYHPGELVVAMFERDDGRLHQAFYPFARAVETVSDPEDIWVHAVERYVALQEGDPSGIDGRVRSAIDILGQVDTIEAAAIRSDLIDYLHRNDDTWRPQTWLARSGPTDSAAVVPAAEAPKAFLWCRRGGPMQIMIKDKAALRAAVRIGDDRFETKPPVPLTLPGDGFMREDTDVLVAEFVAPERLAALLRSATVPVAIEIDDQTVAAAPPADALLRWSQRCAQLVKELPLPDDVHQAPQ